MRLAPMALAAATALAAAVALATPESAAAFYGATGTGSGAAAVGTLSAPAVNVPRSSTGVVEVSLATADLATPSPESEPHVSYAVERSSDDGASWGAASGTCAGALGASATRCSDEPDDGTYRYRVRARFRSWTAVGAPSEAVTVTRAVLTAPTIEAVPTDRSADPAPRLWFGGGGGQGHECRLDGGGWAPCASPRALADLADGAHTFEVRATRDEAIGPAASVTWIVDRSAPALTSATPDPSASSDASLAFSHPGYLSLQCRLDGSSPWASCASPKVFLDLTEGRHAFEVRALDPGGVATAAASFEWLVAKGAPAITSRPESPTSRATATFAFSAPGFTAYRCRLDAGAFAPCDPGSITYPDLSLGPHTLTVHALDAAGVPTADAVAAWTVVAAPVLVLTPGCQAANGKRDSVAGTTTLDTGTVTVRFYSGPSAAGTPAATLTTSVFAGPDPYTWSVTTANKQLTGGQRYTAQATQLTPAGGTSDPVTCSFVAS